MAIQQLKIGFSSLMGGQQQGLHPTLLPETQYAKGINILSRNGLVKTRTRWNYINSLSGRGIFQGAFLYRLNDADRLIYVLSGMIYSKNLSTGLVTIFSGLSIIAPKVYFCKADKYCIIQDGISNPVILDGDVLHDNNLDDTPPNQYKIPIGTLMAYGHGRLFLVPKYVPETTEDGRPFFLAGDIILPSDPSTCLVFSETEYLSEGGAMGLPTEMGFIKALGFFRNAATGNGLGALVVIARDGISGFAINNPRSEWKDTDFSQVMFLGNGTESPNTLLNVNDDLVYRSQDGIRTIRYTQQQVAGSSGALSNPSMSQEVVDILNLDSGDDLINASSVFVDNRLLMTSGGYVDGRWNGLISLDMSPVSTVTNNSATPMYDGVWTGLKYEYIFKALDNGKDSCYAINKISDTEHSLYCLNNNTTQWDGGSYLVKSRLFTKSYDFSSEGSNVAGSTKEFSFAEVWLSDIVGQVVMTMYYRPDSFALWSPCNTVLIKGNSDGKNQVRRRIRFSPTTTYDPSTSQQLSKGSTIQFMLEWNGVATINLFIAYSFLLTNESNLVCNENDTNPIVETILLTDPNDYDYLCTP